MRKIHTYINICHLSAFQLKFQRCFGIRKKQILLNVTFLEILAFLSAEVWEEGNRYLDGSFRRASCRCASAAVPSDTLLTYSALQIQRLKLVGFPPVPHEF